MQHKKIRSVKESLKQSGCKYRCAKSTRLVSSLLKYSNLQSLNVKNNWFWKDSFDEFLESLEKSKIKRLSITFDDLNDSEIVNFANAIEKSNVRFLDLRIAAMDQLPEIFKQIKDLKLIN
ncbi:hypothetical protein O9G_005693 [Rozella allomycis CSF55]|uniref:RNI-like protein n=1 Tax=Rozella allomycis (strain CSF55) TaxID=988480 RepID=A0A075AMD5_ROZAC|nr:hypothetical protein O9G_005693 [Rozella allomycis CSF55]|eukprot:EPZ30759.1 hypothetical protein O9G_005693 [Rozella allomycis CSF55]